MKTIKAILFSVIILFSLNATAQDIPLRFGVKAGANLSTFTGDLDDLDAKFGFNIGVTVDYSITENIYLSSGLEFTNKGAKAEYDFRPVDGDKYDVTMTANYLQLPIHIGYKLPISEGVIINFHGGPYLAYGIGGKTKFEYGNKTEKENTFGDDGFKRFDFGLGLGAGVEFGNINVGLGYDFGLVNIADDDDDDISVKNGNAYLTVGYKF